MDYHKQATELLDCLDADEQHDWHYEAVCATAEVLRLREENARLDKALRDIQHRVHTTTLSQADETMRYISQVSAAELGKEPPCPEELKSKRLTGDVRRFTRHAGHSLDGCDPTNCNEPSHYFYEDVTDDIATLTRERDAARKALRKILADDNEVELLSDETVAAVKAALAAETEEKNG